MNEEDLVKKCVEGDVKAQRELFNKFASTMLGVTLRYMKDRTLAEDVLQDGFIKVFNNLQRFEYKGSLEGWIRRIIVNTALDQLRKDKKYQDDIEIDNSYFEPVQKSEVEGKMQADVLMEIIQELPEGYRVVFNMYAIEGYSHKEIADALGISENTSKSQYSRAKATLRTLLEKYDIER